MFEWIPVKSQAMKAVGFDADTDTIYIRFHDDQEWWYSECPQFVWNEFNSPGQSKGAYLNKVLKFKPNGRYST